MSADCCAVHPSREATFRCRSCGRRLCDRCVQVWARHIYCSRSCFLRGAARDAAGAAKAFALLAVPAPWSIAAVAAAAALLLTTIGLTVAELLTVVALVGDGGVERHERSVPLSPAGILERQGRRWTLSINGAPSTEILVVAAGRPLLVLELDARGTARAGGLELEGADPELTLIPIGRRHTKVRSAAPATSAAPPDRADRMLAKAPPTVRTQSLATHSSTGSATARAATATVDARGTPPVLDLITDVGPLVALTFDGGSSSNGTSQLLDQLRALDLRVTFFLTGEFIEREPELVRRILLDGHEVGNHTYSHPHLTTYATNRRHALADGVDESFLTDQLGRTEIAFRRATGRRMAPLWRAPYGEESPELRAWALKRGYLHVRWSSLAGASLDSRDWIENEHDRMYEDAREIVERILRFPQLEGGLVLMHASSTRSDPAWSALPELVRGLRARGVTPVQVSAALQQSPRWKGWLRQAEQNHRTDRSVPPR